MKRTENTWRYFVLTFLSLWSFQIHDTTVSVAEFATIYNICIIIHQSIIYAKYDEQ